MLGAQIDVIQPQIRFFFCISTATARQKNKRQLWLNAIKRVDWTETIVKLDRVCSLHFLSEKVQ